MRQYYIHVNGQPQGPFTIEELKKMNINRFTYVWAEDFEDWRKAEDVGELTSILIVTPPPFTSPSTPVKSAPPQQNPNRRPDTHMAGAILVTLFFCLPLGLIAVVAANDVSTLYRAGDYQGAQEASDKAMKWIYYSVFVGLFLYVLLAFFYFGSRPAVYDNPAYSY